MADALYVQEGGSVDYTPGSAVLAGDVVVQGEMVGVAKLPIAANALGALSITGVFDFLKTAATVYAVGVVVFWDVADSEATEASDTGTNKRIGHVVLAAASGDATVRCRLQPAADSA